MNTAMNPAILPKLEITRRFKAPAAEVFAAWTDPAQIGAWIGPGEWKTTQATIDLRVGGEYCFAMSKGGRHIRMLGVYREITPPARLVFTWRQEGDPEMDFGDTLVTVELTDLGDSTDLRLTHSGFVDAAYRDGHAYGWNECFDSIERLLAERMKDEG
jgi:uncharacterized protein YndB with AHSA1/START domain